MAAGAMDVIESVRAKPQPPVSSLVPKIQALFESDSDDSLQLSAEQACLEWLASALARSASARGKQGRAGSDDADSGCDAICNPDCWAAFSTALARRARLVASLNGSGSALPKKFGSSALQAACCAFEAAVQTSPESRALLLAQNTACAVQVLLGLGTGRSAGANGAAAAQDSPGLHNANAAVAVFRPALDALGSFVRSLISMVVAREAPKCAAAAGAVPVVAPVLHCLEGSLDQVCKLVQEHGNRRKVFDTFVGKWLQPLLELYAWLNPGGTVVGEHTTLCARIEQVLNQAFFTPEHMGGYPTAFTTIQLFPEGRVQQADVTAEKLVNERRGKRGGGRGRGRGGGRGRDAGVAPVSCYQRRFFDQLQLLLKRGANVAGSDSDGCASAPIVRALPMLARLYAARRRLLGSHDITTPKAQSRADRTAVTAVPSDFSFWLELFALATHAVLGTELIALNQQVQDGVKGASHATELATINDMLSLLLPDARGTSGVHHPSEDWGWWQRRALSTVARHLLCHVEGTAAAMSDADCELKGFAHLLNASHESLEPILARVVKATLRRVDVGATTTIQKDCVNTPCMKLWLLLLRSFAKLRQMEQLLLAIFAASTDCIEACEHVALSVPVTETFIDAVVQFPPGQLPAFWALFSRFLAPAEVQRNDDPRCSPRVVAHFFTLFCCNMRISEHNAEQLHQCAREMCAQTIFPMMRDLFASNSVGKKRKRQSSRDAVSNGTLLALELLAVVLDFSIRCAMWRKQDDADALSSLSEAVPVSFCAVLGQEQTEEESPFNDCSQLVTAALPDLLQRVSSMSSTKKTRTSRLQSVLEHLALQRLSQLAPVIARAKMYVDAESSSSQQLLSVVKSEAAALAEFVLSSRCAGMDAEDDDGVDRSDGGSFLRSWILAMQNLKPLIRYGGSDQLCAITRWILESSPMEGQCCSRHVLHDAGFYELQPLREHVMPAAAELWVQHALLCSTSEKSGRGANARKSRKAVGSAEDVLHAAQARVRGGAHAPLSAVLQRHAEQCAKVLKKRQRAMSGQKARRGDNASVSMTHIRKVSHYLATVAAIPESETYFHNVDHILGLDAVVSVDMAVFSLLQSTAEGPARSALLRAVAQCRMLMARFLQSLTRSSDDWTSCVCADEGVLQWLLRTALHYQQQQGSCNEVASDDVIASTVDIACHVCAHASVAGEAGLQATVCDFVVDLLRDDENTDLRFAAGLAARCSGAVAESSRETPGQDESDVSSDSARCWVRATAAIASALEPKQLVEAARFGLASSLLDMLVHIPLTATDSVMSTVSAQLEHWLPEAAGIIEARTCDADLVSSCATMLRSSCRFACHHDVRFDLHVSLSRLVLSPSICCSLPPGAQQSVILAWTSLVTAAPASRLASLFAATHAGLISRGIDAAGSDEADSAVLCLQTTLRSFSVIADSVERRQERRAVMSEWLPRLIASLVSSASTLPFAASALVNASERSMVAVAALDSLCWICARQDVAPLVGADFSLVLGALHPLLQFATLLEHDLHEQLTQIRDGSSTFVPSCTITAWGKQGSARVFEHSCTLIGALFKHYAQQTYLVLPNVVNVIRAMFLILLCGLGDASSSLDGTGQGAANPTLDLSPGHLARDTGIACACEVARLLAKLTSHKSALSKHIVPALAHYMFVASAVNQDDAVRNALLPGVFCLVEMCSKHELQQLHLLLDSAGQEVLKTTRASFEMMHRYTGKV